MLIIIVRDMVVPTTLYHYTVKSVYWPANRGTKSGSYTSDILALTKRMIIPLSEVKNRVTYCVDELNEEHLNHT